MNDKISFLIPYRSDNGHRERAFQWIQRYYHRVFPNCELIVSTPSSKLFNRSEAINKAAKIAQGEVLVIADSDILFSPRVVESAVNELDRHAMIVPFRMFVDLDVYRTRELLLTEPKWPLSIDVSDQKRNGMYEMFAGKINVMKRKTFEKTGGFDERFLGWGGEDDAFVRAVVTLHGPMKKLPHTIYHLWHPPMNYQQNPHGKKNWELLSKYRKAQGNPYAMIRLIQK